MSSIFDPLRDLVHDVSSALLDQGVPKKVSDMVTASVTSGFEVVEDLLKIVKDITQEETTASKEAPTS
jgi:hypothetical protein